MKIPIELTVSILDCALQAGEEILKVYDLPDFQTAFKNDRSPLTLADLASNKVINEFLRKTPYPIISEENKQIDYATRKTWETCWLVDPLDGTKEFIKKNGEFTVNIALCKKGKPILGVIYVPAVKELYFGNVTNQKAYKIKIKDNHITTADLFSERNRIYPKISISPRIRVVGSRSHMTQETITYVESLKKNGEDIEVVSKGSSLKFCLVAEGKADVYPRFAPTMEWDTAAGHAICKAVGLKVTDQETGQELRYNKENLLNPHFLVTI
ncbi:3'(2'),5'-bisphosphate nucleotidase [Muriicola jejuensis]|uniref:3'(2'),5'-bisphosphate nucleotidase CysQ n=1 Tax=Muriicola jejuensis TaxID=504488 RepID=A0A6P0UGH4_9FLAO|nr:3'(2'),5'-bisphosphate nucleotidase CysQ [Muriicola jejuensis]NER11550.1 3'(2'),5'-bisphosphate nucleotidase CysQ [Muriicola jejuensis]SMP19738.1 3'(2'),5'-bisphosphate nucleotidase [Muriicola jejuensis]